jgi:COMPASS component SWD2
LTADWTKIKFSNSGKNILVTTTKSSALILDGYDASVVNVFVGEEEHAEQPLAACFSSDDKTILGGHADGTISCWDATNGELIKKLSGHVGRVGCIASNPKYSQIASSCTNTALWLW